MDQEIETDLAKPVHRTDSPQALTSHSLQQEIRKLKLRIAPGLDSITSQMLQELPQEGILQLLHIFNAVIRCSYLPEKFKLAQIIMVPKPGKDPTDVTSYRPVSLLSTISKILEKLLSRHHHSNEPK